MSEQQQIQPKRTEEKIQESVGTSQYVAMNQIPQGILEDDIDISDLYQESLDIAKVFKQRGGQ